MPGTLRAAPARPSGRACGRLLDGGKVADHAERVSHDELGCVSSNTQPLPSKAGERQHERAPVARPVRGHRRRHRRQQPRVPPGPARLAGHRAARQGAAAEPRRLHRPRVQLHLPGRPLARDDRPDAGQRAAVQGAGRLHRVRRHRGRPHRGAHAGAAPAHRLVQGVGHRVRAGRPGAGRRARAVPRPVGHHRRLPHAERRRRRLAARRHDHARAGAGDGRARRARRCRDRRHGRRGRPHPPGAHRPRRHRGRDGRHRLRGLEPEAGRGWPARASRSPRRCTR